MEGALHATGVGVTGQGCSSGQANHLGVGGQQYRSVTGEL